MQTKGMGVNFAGPIAGTEIRNGILVDTGMRRNRANALESRNRDGRRLMVVLQKAVEVIGSENNAYRWLGTRVRTLGYATPISLLAHESGAERVLAALENLEYGVW